MRGRLLLRPVEPEVCESSDDPSLVVLPDTQTADDPRDRPLVDLSAHGDEAKTMRSQFGHLRGWRQRVGTALTY